MRVIIARHGKAEPDSPSGRDADRPLRHLGVRQVRWLGERLSSMEFGLAIERLISSRAERVDRTARAIADACGVEVEYDDRLMTEEPAGRLIDLLEDVGGSVDSGGSAGSVCLVGHNNQLSVAACVLAGRELDPIRTGEAVVLDVDPRELMGSGVVVERLRLPRERSGAGD